MVATAVPPLFFCPRTRDCPSDSSRGVSGVTSATGTHCAAQHRLGPAGEDRYGQELLWALVAQAFALVLQDPVLKITAVERELYGEKLHSLPESSSTCNREKAQGYFIVAFLIPLSAYLPIWRNDKMCQHFFSLLQSMKRDSQSHGEKTVKGPPTFLGRPL